MRFARATERTARGAAEAGARRSFELQGTTRARTSSGLPYTGLTTMCVAGHSPCGSRRLRLSAASCLSDGRGRGGGDGIVHRSRPAPTTTGSARPSGCRDRARSTNWALLPGVRLAQRQGGVRGGRGDHHYLELAPAPDHLFSRTPTAIASLATRHCAPVPPRLLFRGAVHLDRPRITGRATVYPCRGRRRDHIMDRSSSSDRLSRCCRTTTELHWLEHARLDDQQERHHGLALPIYDCHAGMFDVVGGRKRQLEERAIDGRENVPRATAGSALRRCCVKIACRGRGAPVAISMSAGRHAVDAPLPGGPRDRRSGSRPTSSPSRSRASSWNWFYAMLGDVDALCCRGAVQDDLRLRDAVARICHV